ncbi:MAG: hypothetical protein PHP25_00040 [Candidatus Moranbacteria bacterium]|nr:hypothetical protein [Candidatus Moranbacteria bacterium]
MLNPLVEKKIENFSGLSDQECAAIVQNYLLETLDSETNFEWELLTKFIEKPYELREPLCTLFNSAVRHNQQILGERSVSEWIDIYRVTYNERERGPGTFFEFVSGSNSAKLLSQKEQVKLMRILRIFDYLFIEPFFDVEEGPAAEFMRHIIYPSTTPNEILSWIPEISGSAPGPSKKNAALQLKQALQKFPKIGEQTITSSPLNIKSFDRPVRPSIKNWLYDYTSVFGQGAHDSMQRTNYLFRSENAKNLSSTEREKLGIILKSFDENTPLPIDTKNNEVVFEVRETYNVEPAPRIAAQSAAGGRRTQSPTRSPEKETFIRPYPQSVAKPTAPPNPVENSFVRPYPPISRPAGNVADRSTATEKPPVPPQPAPKQMPDPALSKARLFPSPTSRGIPQSQAFPDTEKIQFVNPYPKPGTHEVIDSRPEMAGEAPVKLKGFSEGAPKDNQGSAPPVLSKARLFPSGKQVAGIPQSQALAPPEPPKPYAPSRPKNVIYPHYGAGRENQPEPKIDGNVVDLSGEK